MSIREKNDDFWTLTTVWDVFTNFVAHFLYFVGLNRIAKLTSLCFCFGELDMTRYCASILLSTLGFCTSKGKKGTLIGLLCCSSVRASVKNAWPFFQERVVSSESEMYIKYSCDFSQGQYPSSLWKNLTFKPSQSKDTTVYVANIRKFSKLARKSKPTKYFSWTYIFEIWKPQI